MCYQLTDLNVFSVERIKIKSNFTGLIQVILKIGIFCVDVSTFLCLKIIKILWFEGKMLAQLFTLAIHKI